MSQKGTGDEARLEQLRAKIRKVILVERETVNVNLQSLLDVAIEVIELPANSVEFKTWAAGYLMGLSMRVKPPGVKLEL